MLKLQLHTHIVATPIVSHNSKPPLLHIYSCYATRAVHTNIRNDI